jgi:hypothetical protein
MKIEKPPRESDTRRSRPWEDRAWERNVGEEEAARERRRAQEMETLKQTLQSLTQP